MLCVSIFFVLSLIGSVSCDEGSCTHLSCETMIYVEPATFVMGFKGIYPEEEPTHMVPLGGFWIDKYEVTNHEFKKFVEETGYLTVAERPLKPEDYPGVPLENLIPGGLVFTPPPARPSRSRKFDSFHWSNWWRYEPGAKWTTPTGLGSTAQDDYPVVQVSFEDARAYCKWMGKSLPTEAQYEYAARGGTEEKNIFSWGDEETPGGQFLANFWQGDFPYSNSELDGFAGLAPVGSFPANGFGIYDLIGNVWEWT
eukprot:TRINITY_DN8354_c0_g1_i12.p1 TRINITY_DN8354_c0_g1~~TRINITY_DN8354_c0_g1_i12.p1  ORF type:complete len:254 (-),score=41.50 TRINITY_DN8354_c0_g1_i12:419-1180(-)